jgi:hypothetical protein
VSKTHKPLLILASMAALAACGGPDEQSGLAGHQTGDALTTNSVDGPPGVLPPVIEFRKLHRDRHIVPSFRVASHFVNEIAASPDDKTHFRAYGVDAATKVVYYHIDGHIERDLVDFLTVVNKDIVHNGLQAQSVGQEYTWGGTGQIVIGAPPDPNPPVPGGIPQAALSKLIGLAINVQVAIRESLTPVAR